MKNSSDTLLEVQHDKVQNQTGGLDPFVILSLILKNWYFFLIAVAASLFGAHFYLGHTMRVYMTSTTIQINETGEKSLVSNDELLQGLGLPGGMRNLENQIKVLSSRALTEKALRELPFEIEYYIKTRKNSIPIYPEIPIKVIYDNENMLPEDTEFSIMYLGNNKFIVETAYDNFMLNKQVSFGDIIEIPGAKFQIECKKEAWMNRYRDQKIYFEIYSRTGLINYFNKRLSVELLSQGGSILRVSIVGTNRAKDADFLNKLAETFHAISLDKKNAEATRRIQFIDDQLVGITDSLSRTENKLQKFRSTNRVMDVSAQGQAIITQVTLLENERARLNLEANYYDYLTEYLAKGVTKQVPIVPITMGITDPGLTKLVSDLAELQGQILNKGAGEMNPIQNLMTQKINTTKDALVETLNGLKRANSIAITDNQEQIKKVNAQASALPVTERQLLGIERKFKLNDQLYTFLLETRANQQMQKASNIADSEVVDPADEHFSTVVSPNPMRVYFVGLFAGFIIPFLFLFLNFLLNKKLKEEDIRRMTEIPVVGNIPHSTEKTNNVVFELPNSTVAEAYRLLRSRMQFFTKEATTPIILITSSMPGEGKTFTSINLASAYSLLGKKTILIGFDLRKPKIFKDFNLSNERGVSTWLIGRDKLEDIIQETPYENLSLISSGPVPPNPSELISSDKSDELFKLLKEKYDYIIVDSSPIGIVSDTFHLASLADTMLLVVRPGRSLRDTFSITLREINLSETKGVSLVINDIQSESRNYVYGEMYGYTSDNDQHKRFRFFRKKAKQG
jgi:tyrosine-protein kinase Etk/Wzc